MGQVTRAIGARPRLILPPVATPERWRHCATTTIQQTTLRGNGNVVPESVNRSYSRDSIPILGSTSEGTIGGSPGGSACHVSDCVIRTKDRSKFAAAVSSAILRNPRWSSALPMCDRHCASYSDSVQRTARGKFHDRRGEI